MKYRPYPKYKNSGIEWLGEVPEHWESAALQWISRRYAGGTPDRNNPDYWTDGTIPWINSGTVNQGVIREPSEYITELGLRESSARWVPRNAIVMALAGQGKTKGMAALTAIRTTCNQSMAAIVPRSDVDAVFLRWWLHCQYNRIRGLAGDEQRDGLNLEMVGSIPCPIPTITEQHAIASFLDRETARIDALIEKKQRQIELLQEKRAALISHAVTKGLDPSVKMKDSGIEWLGEVPEHWVIVAVKRIARKIQTGCTPPTAQTQYYENGTVPWFGPGSFQDQITLSNPVKFIHEDAVAEGVARLFESNSIMIVTIGATIGKVGLIVEPASSNQQITAITPNQKKAIGRFLAYQMKTFENALRAIAPSTTLPIIDQQEVGAVPCALPPLSEQRKIVEYVDSSSDEIDLLAVKVRTSIDMLREYRTALISAAVTGKIDVREEAA